MMEELEKLKSENLKGATYITLKSTEILKSAVLKDGYQKAVKLAKEISEAHPSMGSLYNLWAGLVRSGREDSLDFIERFEREFKRASEILVSKTARLMKEAENILTHSYSSVIFKAVSKCDKREISIFCTESRPQMEGVKMAEDLCRQGFEVTLITDAAAASLVREMDMFLIGADWIGEDFLAHKCGTYPIALAAREAGTEVVCVSQSHKMVTGGRFGAKEGSKKELPSGCFKVRNPYFDVTPLELVDQIVTERD